MFLHLNLNNKSSINFRFELSVKFTIKPYPTIKEIATHLVIFLVVRVIALHPARSPELNFLNYYYPTINAQI